jgi:hypothetical protein
MNTPLEYSCVPIAPSHSTGELVSRERKSDAIVLRAYKINPGFAPEARTVGAMPRREVNRAAATVHVDLNVWAAL